MSRVTPKVQRAVVERAGGRCEGVKADGDVCGIDVVALARMPKMFLDKALPKGAAAYEIDHKRPYSDSADNSLDNLQVLCGNCHADKSASERPEYRKGERSHTLDRVQPGAGAVGLNDGLGRAIYRRDKAAGM